MDAYASTHDARYAIIISKKGATPTVRNSFIQMSKLTNLKGRINYISSKARQENLYAVYETTDRKFWTELAKCNQEEFKKSGEEKLGKVSEAIAKTDAEQTVEKVVASLTANDKSVPAMPVKSVLASKFHRLENIYQKLDEQNKAIYEREQQIGILEQKLPEEKGIFKAKERKDLQEQKEQLQTQIANMKRYLPTIVQGHGYKNVKEFLAEYQASKVEYGGCCRMGEAD